MPLVKTIRHHFADRRARRQLDAELAAFASASDRADLDAQIEAHTADESSEVRAILLRQDARRLIG